MPTKINLTGQRFGRLVVVEESGHIGKDLAWLSKCDCGNTTRTRGQALRTGNTKSCGCIHKEQLSERNARCSTPHHITHGMTDTSTYRIWAGMKKRCQNENHRAFRHYGGRGISVCARWDHFENFLADMGERPDGLSIDRIDVNGNYEPGNCRWATNIQQGRNRRNNRVISFSGQSMCLSRWAESMGINIVTLHTRLRDGWSARDALSLPVEHGRSLAHRKSRD